MTIHPKTLAALATGDLSMVCLRCHDPPLQDGDMDELVRAILMRADKTNNPLTLLLSDNNLGDSAISTLLAKCSAVTFKYIELSLNPSLTNSCGASISQLNVERIGLNSCVEIGDEALAKMSESKSIEILSLADTNITDAGVESVLKMSHLRYLDIEDNEKVSPEMTRRVESFNQRKKKDHLTAYAENPRLKTKKVKNEE